jgi:acetyl-CoA/propionyl-CoA carboxylase biotin carboxyl carrier protein
MQVEGVATTIPADLAILRHPDFAALEHSTKWVESTLDLSDVAAPGAPAAAEGDEAPKVRRDTVVEVNGKRFSVAMWIPASAAAPVAAAGGAGAAGAVRPRRKGGHAAHVVAGSGSVVVPMQGTIVKVTVAEGDEVATGQTVCLLEAMKMENAITADKDGIVKEIKVEAGQAVSAGDIVLVIE